MNIKVREGTPIHGGKGLCHSCKYSHVFRSAAESEVTVLCIVHPCGIPIQIRKPVVECSDYQDKVTKSLYDMKQIAWVLATKNGKHIGFVSAREVSKKEDKGEIDAVEID